MSEGNSQRIKVTVRWVQILDNLEPMFVDKGQFFFRSVVSSDNLGGVREERRYPATSTMNISAAPGRNKEIIKWVIFEGEITDHLVIELYGEEVDLLTANDHLDPYRREFRGPVSTWLGTYGPGEDFSNDQADGDDPEMMSNWRVNIYIDPA